MRGKSGQEELGHRLAYITSALGIDTGAKLTYPVMNAADTLPDVVSGKFNPTGKLPVTLPVSNEAVTNNKEDLPGYLEPEGYALFNYGEGLSYN